MEFVVRPIASGDGACLKDVRLRALAEAPYAFASTYEREAAFDDAEWEARAERSGDGRTSVGYLAEAGGRCVGLVGAHLDGGEQIVKLVSMWTAPEARRAGVGRALVQAVLGWAADIGVPEVQLWVARDNEGAQAFYRSMGFEALPGFRPLASDPCRDELRMRLVLAGLPGGAEEGSDDGDDHRHAQQPAQRP